MGSVVVAQCTLARSGSRGTEVDGMNSVGQPARQPKTRVERIEDMMMYQSLTAMTENRRRMLLLTLLTFMTLC